MVLAIVVKKGGFSFNSGSVTIRTRAGHSTYLIFRLNMYSCKCDDKLIPRELSSRLYILPLRHLSLGFVSLL